MDIPREPIKIEQMKAALDHGYEVLVIVNGCYYTWDPEDDNKQEVNHGCI